MPPTGPRKSPVPPEGGVVGAGAAATGAAALSPEAALTDLDGHTTTAASSANDGDTSTNGHNPSSRHIATSNSSNALAQLTILDAKTSLQDDGVEKVDLVEWGPGRHEDGYDTDQTLAPKPRAERLGEPCGCQMPDILLKLDANGEQNSPFSLEHLVKEHKRCRDDSCVNYAMREECRSNCEAAEFCGNKRLQNQDFVPTAVIDAGPKGRGLAVLRDCLKGDFLAEYVGEAISNKSLPKLFRRYQQERRLYIMALDDKTYIDARRKGGVARFINHSCNPNAKVERWKVKGILRAVVVATADIKKGSEVTFDYQWQRQRGRALTKCHCLEPNCRGTLEIQAKSMTEEQDPTQNSNTQTTEGRWIKGLSTWTENSPDKDTLQKADETLINRAIRVHSKEHQEYFVGEVTGYDETKGLHEVLYQEDFVEMWENLHESDWMVLVEDNGQPQFSIIRKKRVDVRRTTDKEKDTKLSLFAGSAKPLKNYVYVPNAVKEGLWTKHLVERCERTCNVQIRAVSHTRSSAMSLNEEESQERAVALSDSPSGVAWKLTISGGDVFRAHNILTKNIAYVRRILDEAAQEKGPDTEAPPTPTQQIIYPRLIADAVKRKLPFIREKCRNVSLSFAASASITKKFSRLVLEGQAGPDLENAKSLLWSTLLSLCQEMKAPMTPFDIPQNLGFLGGELTKDQLFLLGVTPVPTKKKARGDAEVIDAQYHGHFLNSFGNAFKCAVWVQPDEDMGRISSHKVVGGAMSTNLRNVYIGCDPNDLAARWGAIKERVQSLERGTRFIHLGGDRIYIPLMQQNGVDFFSYVRSITGAAVSIDRLTEDHLMIDGASTGDASLRLPPEVVNLSAREKAELAGEIMRLQIEIYRNHYARKQAWVFGRDWSLSTTEGPDQETANAHRSVFGKLDSKSVPQCCMEIAGIVSKMDLPKDVGAHAAMILYRYLAVEKTPDMKAREASLACAYIANKAQKDQKWRKMEVVMKAGYATFYPETKFDLDREDVQLLIERTIAVESEILQKLEYDVFFKDTKSILSTMKASLAAKMEHFTSRVTELAFSGEVLGAGAQLWLRHDVESVLVACAGLLGANVEPLVQSLALAPLTVATAADMLLQNIKFGSPSSVPFLRMSRGDAITMLTPIQATCGTLATTQMTGYRPEASDSSPLSTSVSRESGKCYVIRNIPNNDCRQNILPHLDKILTDSCCDIFVDPSQGAATQTSDVFLIGPWRAVALAEHSLCNLSSFASKAMPIPPISSQSAQCKSKFRPGALSTEGMQTSEEWNGTNHSLAWTHEKGIRLGGKSCVAARVSRSTLGSAGMGWWVPKAVVTGPSGTISSCLLGQSGNQNYSQQLASFASAYLGDLEEYPILSALATGGGGVVSVEKSMVAISLQRWPPEKVSENEKKKAEKSKKGIPVGFSPAALQEMELLTRLHSSVGSPRGHPNFVLPVGICLPTEVASKNEPAKKEEDPMFSLFKSTEENESALQRDKKVKESSHIIFDPSPFVLPRFISRKKGSEDILSFPGVVSSWFHDLLSALAHCHSHNVILRSLLPDQIVIDSNGVAKLSGLYRCSIMHNDKESRYSAVELAIRVKKKKTYNEDELSITPTTAPELLLGCPRFSKETDVWMMGCVLANILLGKALFTGKDRDSLLTSHYKVVGAPSKDNYPQAQKFPLYEKPFKKYKRGVEKFFEHVLKDKAEALSSHIDLLGRLLHLDPTQRCTVEDALKHPSVTPTNLDETSRRTEYAVQWNALQNSLWEGQAKPQPTSSLDSQSYQKRKALLLSAVGGDSDDLYDLDDLLAPSSKGTSPNKKARSS